MATRSAGVQFESPVMPIHGQLGGPREQVDGTARRRDFQNCENWQAPDQTGRWRLQLRAPELRRPVGLDALVAKLQDEGAKSFVASQNEPLAVIDSKRPAVGNSA
jgi:hypothetical protein